MVFSWEKFLIWKTFIVITQGKGKKQTNKKYMNVVGKKSKNVVLVGENTEVLRKTHPSAFDV